MSRTARRSARLPQALVIGPQRAGTTWLHELLAAREDVCLPHGVKETYFFDLRFERGRDWYAKQFVADAGARVLEVGPSYFHVPAAPRRVADVLGQIPVVCTLRHPAERTYSLWVHWRRYGMTDLPFAEALDAIPDLLDSSRYATNLRRWREALSRENVHVLFMEQLRADRQGYADAACRALGLQPARVPEQLSTRVNEGAFPRSHRLARLAWKASRALRSAGLHSVVNTAKSAGLQRFFFGSPSRRPPPPISDAERARLLETLRPDVEELERMLGVDLGAWRC